MKCKHYIYRGMLFVSMCALCVACDDWLDVQPKSQIEDIELFESETGFKEALSGVYSSMVSDNTYSKELLYGAMAVLGHEWDNYPTSQSASSYGDLTDYNYSTTASENLIAAIWSTSYNSIANVNNLLKYIDNAKKLFVNDNYAIIKGEALALRAFLHFDLLRCFGVSYAVNPNMPAIPYSTDLSYRVFPQLTVSAVAGKLEADLLEAASLLKEVDPIATGKKITELDDNGYLMNRQVHLNYYAVKGLQARVYMWMQRYTEAEQCAEEVIKSKTFEWAKSEDMKNNNDLAFATEQLFALNNINLSSISDNYFNVENYLVTFSIKESTWNDYYKDAADYRYVYLFQNGTLTQNSNWYYLKKYNIPSSGDSYYTNKMPLIRLSEMYLIEAECKYRANDEDAYKPLNELRTARNISTLYESNPGDFYEELIKEYRREFIGEGQLFFLYKRLNRSSVIGSSIDMIAGKGYTFPLPVSETDAAQRENNR